MATNGNNSGNMEFTNTPNIGNGVMGNIQGRMAKSNFSNTFWNEESGFLKNSISDLDNIQKKYNEISKSAESMNKTTKKSVDNISSELKIMSSYFKDIRNTREVTDKEAIDAMREYSKLIVKAQELYIKLLNEGYNTQKEGNKEHLETINQAVKMLNEYKKLSKDTNVYLSNTEKALGQSTDNLATSISKTLGEAGNKLKDITNMFNLQTMANNSMEQNARSRAAIMTNVNSQFNFTNNRQFENFKNSLNDNLKDMNKSTNYIFNTSDLKNYMSNLSAYGITDTKIAEQQMKNSIIAEKYLGTSVETQAAMFKWMKRSNNPEIIANHNKTVVGLLKSQLGVSKDQLDKLSKIAYESTDSKAAIGMSPEAITAQSEALVTSGNALSALYGDDTAKQIIDSINDFITHPGDAGWTKILGGDYQRLYDNLYSNTSIEGQTKAIQDLIETASKSGLLTAANNMQEGLYKAIGKYTANAEGGGKSDAFLGVLNNLDTNKLNEYFDKSLSGALSTTDKDVDYYIQQTTQTTATEKILNLIDTFVNGLPWKWTFHLANLAFAMYLGSGIVKGIGSILDLKKITSSGVSQITQMAGGSGVAGSAIAGLASGAAIVGLTAATIEGIADASRAGMNKSYDEKYNSTLNQLKGTNLEGNTSYASAAGIQEGINSQTGLGKDMGNVVSGTSYGFKKLFTKSKSELNTALTKWMYESGALNGMNNIIAWAFMLDKAGSLEDYNTATGSNFSKSNLYDLLTKTGYSSDYINSTANNILQAGWKPYLDNKGGRMNEFKLDISGYHKNGLDYVPRDNYKALLHKGEMVLNAKEAETLRNAMQMNNMGGVEASWYSIDDGRRGGNYPRKITSAYKEKRSGNPGYHTGVDFAFPEGAAIGAAYPGKIVQSYLNSSYGNMIMEKFDNGKYAIYAHQSKRVANVGDIVKEGDLIGYAGSTGHVTGPHLHFEVRNSSKYLTDTDPLAYATKGLFRTGTGSISGSSGTPTNENSTNASSSIPVASNRFVPKAFQSNSSSEGMGGADKVVSSVNNGFDKLLNYLSSIREEQEAQREIINAFSQSRPGNY